MIIYLILLLTYYLTIINKNKHNKIMNETKNSEVKEGDYRIYISHEVITIQHLDYSKVLKIEKLTGNTSECDQNILKNFSVLSVMRPHCILGIIKIEDHPFLIYVESAEVIGSIQNSEIFKIQEVNYIPLFDEDNGTTTKEITNLLISIKNLLTMGFYYSF